MQPAECYSNGARNGFVPVELVSEGPAWSLHDDTAGQSSQLGSKARHLLFRPTAAGACVQNAGGESNATNGDDGSLTRRGHCELADSPWWAASAPQADIPSQARISPDEGEFFIRGFSDRAVVPAPDALESVAAAAAAPAAESVAVVNALSDARKATAYEGAHSNSAQLVAAWAPHDGCGPSGAASAAAAAAHCDGSHPAGCAPPRQQPPVASDGGTEERYWEGCSDDAELGLCQEAGSFSASFGTGAAARAPLEAQQPGHAWRSNACASVAGGGGGPVSSLTNISEALTRLLSGPQGAAAESYAAEGPRAGFFVACDAGDCLSGPGPTSGSPLPVPRDLPAPLPRQRRPWQAPCEAVDADLADPLAIRSGSSPLQVNSLLTRADIHTGQRADWEEPACPPSPPQQSRSLHRHSPALSSGDAPQSSLPQDLSPLDAARAAASHASPAAQLVSLHAADTRVGCTSSDGVPDSLLRLADSPLLLVAGAVDACPRPLPGTGPHSHMERASDGSWTVHASAQSASQPSVRGLSGSSKPQEVQHQHQQQAGGSASWLRPPQPSTVGSAATKPPRSSRSSCTELAVAAATRLPAPPVADLVPRPAAPLPPRPPQGAASPQPQQPVQQPMNGHGGLLQPRLPWLAALSAEDAVRYSGSGSEDAATVAHSTNSGPLPRPSACADRSDSSQRGNSGPLRLLPQRASALTPATAAAVVDAALGPDALSAAEGLLFVSAAAPEELLQPLAFQQQLQLQPDEEGLGSTQPPSLPQDLQLWCMGRFKVVRKLYEGYASRVFRVRAMGGAETRPGGIEGELCWADGTLGGAGREWRRNLLPYGL